jgi:hypothetical protein
MFIVVSPCADCAEIADKRFAVPKSGGHTISFVVVLMLVLVIEVQILEHEHDYEHD